MKTSHTVHGLPVHKVGGAEYAVGTDKQADRAARRAVEESLWAFKTSYVVSFVERHNRFARSMSTAASNAFEKALGKVQETACEDAGPLIRVLIGSHFAEFADEAIRDDGRAHFLATYDSEEVDSDDVDGLPKGRVAFRIG